MHLEALARRLFFVNAVCSRRLFLNLVHRIPEPGQWLAATSCTSEQGGTVKFIDACQTHVSHDLNGDHFEQGMDP